MAVALRNASPGTVVPRGTVSVLDRHPVLRVDWPPDDLRGGAERTLASLSALGVEIEAPKDLELLVTRLKQQEGRGFSPAVARDLVARRLVALANRKLAVAGDGRSLVRVLEIDGARVDAPTWVLVTRDERKALEAENVATESLGRAVGTQVLPLFFAVVTIVLSIVALARPNRGWWMWALIAWAGWFVTRLATRRAGVGPWPPARGSRA